MYTFVENNPLKKNNYYEEEEVAEGPQQSPKGPPALCRSEKEWVRGLGDKWVRGLGEEWVRGPIRKRKRGPKAPNRAQRASQLSAGARKEGGRRPPEPSRLFRNVKKIFIFPLNNGEKYQVSTRNIRS